MSTGRIGSSLTGATHLQRIAIGTVGASFRTGTGQFSAWLGALHLDRWPNAIVLTGHLFKDGFALSWRFLAWSGCWTPQLVGRVPTRIADLSGGDLERITAKLVAKAADQGDVEAQTILAEATNYLGIGTASLANLFNPELTVIGGGLTNIGEGLFGPVCHDIARHAFRAPAEAVRVVRTEPGDNVGVLGAVAIAFARTEASQ